MEMDDDAASAIEEMRIELQDARAFEQKSQQAIREARALLKLLGDRMADEDSNGGLVTQIDEVLVEFDLVAIAEKAG